jgi:hypothetical protein
MLQKYNLKEIRKLIGIPSSTFSKLMPEGDYLYHQADRQYYPFVLSKMFLLPMLLSLIAAKKSL